MNKRSKARIAQYRKAVLDRAKADPAYFFKLIPESLAWDRVMPTSAGGNREVNYGNLLRKFHMVESLQITRGTGADATLSRKELKRRCYYGDMISYDALEILDDLGLKDKRAVVPWAWSISAKKAQKAINLLRELYADYKTKQPVNSALDSFSPESTEDVLLSFFDDDLHPGRMGIDLTYTKAGKPPVTVREMLPIPTIVNKKPNLKRKGESRSDVVTDVADLELHTSLYSAINKSLNLPSSPIPPFTFRSVVAKLPKTAAGIKSMESMQTETFTLKSKPQPTKVAEDIIEPKTDTSWDLDVSPKSMFLDAVALFPEFKPCNAVPHAFKVEYNEELMNHFIDTLSRVCNLRNWVVDDIRHHHQKSGDATVTTTVLRNGTLMIVFANVSGLIRVLILTDKTDK